MGLMNFMKEAGEKLLRAGPARENAEANAIGKSPADVQAEERELERAILDYIAVQNLPTQGVTIAFDSSNATITVSGTVPDQQSREKIVLCCGNVQGVAHVNDELTVEQAKAEPSEWYTVKKGDTLSKIAKQHYGDANKYMLIFESNRPMLTDPDKIYPGQMLRIPSAASLH